MESDLQILENPDSILSEDQTQIAKIPPYSATASISLSLSAIIRSNLVINPMISSSINHKPTYVKSPSHVSSLSYLRISSSIARPLTPSFKSKISAASLHLPLSPGSRGSSEPRNAAGARGTSILWFRNDLRVHDNECLNSANHESLSLLPVYCFDPRDYELSGSNRASFLVQSVSDLRHSLRSRGSDLVIRIGKAENVLTELAKEVGADAVYAHSDVLDDGVRLEEKVEAVMKDEGVEVKYFWGSTLYHVEDLPFEMAEMPSLYGEFKERIQGLEIRKTIAALDQLKGKPARGNVECGDVPTLMDLGLNPNASAGQDGTSAGGETEALQRLQKLATEYESPPSHSVKNSIHGANFSCKIAPWLETGCLSPRSVFYEITKTVPRTTSAASNEKDIDTSPNWLMSELVLRDFFRFISRKYSSATKHNAAPASACAGSLT